MIDLRIVHFTRAERGLGVDEVEYQLNRNLMVDACRRHGRVGPLGRARFAFDLTREGHFIASRQCEFEPADTEPHAFYVVDTQYNSERYIYLELLDPNAITRDWLMDLCDTLRWQMQGWGAF